MLAIGHKSQVDTEYVVVENVSPDRYDVDTRTPRQRYDEGFNAYARGASIADLEGDTVAELGWWLANSAEAANDMLEWERAKEIDAAQGSFTDWRI